MNENQSPESIETLREIQIVMNRTLGKTIKINGFGINEIKLSVLKEESTQRGMQIDLQANGSAVAKNKAHIINMLQKLVQESREALWKKNIFFEILYHRVDVAENKIYEYDNPDIGLKRTLYFTAICAALLLK